MTECLIIAGAGGQGIMLLGKVLAEAVMREDKQVTWIASYGAEVRGGTAHCMVVISDENIASPYIDKPDSLIIMNAPSLERFKSHLKHTELLLINSSLVKADINTNGCLLKYPFSDIALNLGNIKVANMVALGCYITKKKIASTKNIFKVIEEIIPTDKEQLLEINQRALKQGMKLL